MTRTPTEREREREVGLLFIHFSSLVSMAPLCHYLDTVAIAVHHMHEFIIGGGALHQETAAASTGAVPLMTRGLPV